MNNKIGKVDVLYKVYAEQFERLIRLEVDKDYFMAMRLANPSDNQLLQNSQKTARLYAEQLKLVEIIGRKIAEAENSPKPTS